MNEQGGPSTPFQPGNPTEPAFETTRSPLLRPFLFLAGFAAVGLIAFLGFRMASDDSGDSESDDSSSPGSVPAIRLDPVEPESLDELQPALDAVADLHDEPLAVWEVDIWADDVRVSIQVPGEPELVDRYTWSDGELSRPAPVELTDAATAALPDNLFSVEAVDPEVVAAILADSRTRLPDDPEADNVATSIQIFAAGRLPDDPDVIVVVSGRDYAKEDDNLWSFTYGPDGTFLRGRPTTEASE